MFEASAHSADKKICHQRNRYHSAHIISGPVLHHRTRHLYSIVKYDHQPNEPDCKQRYMPVVNKEPEKKSSGSGSFFKFTKNICCRSSKGKFIVNEVSEISNDSYSIEYEKKIFQDGLIKRGKSKVKWNDS